MTPAIDAERETLLKTLVAHNVQFVVIGGAGLQPRSFINLGIWLACSKRLT
ncbi:MAG: hypothetical protein M3065_01730 [Actinomycetota bacterium]|nr:hypothetical protein [Actinomycetota bacterium]